MGGENVIAGNFYHDSQRIFKKDEIPRPNGNLILITLHQSIFYKYILFIDILEFYNQEQDIINKVTTIKEMFLQDCELISKQFSSKYTLYIGSITSDISSKKYRGRKESGKGIKPKRKKEINSIRPIVLFDILYVIIAILGIVYNSSITSTSLSFVPHLILIYIMIYGAYRIFFYENDTYPKISLHSIARMKFTIMLITINVLCFVIFNMMMNKKYLDLFVQTNVRIFEQKEYWRLFTSLFFHADINHLIFNMVALFVFGIVVERHYGTKILIIYLVSGVIGSIASLYLLPSRKMYYELSSVNNSVELIVKNTSSLGASGCVYGLLGAVFVKYVAVKNKLLYVVGLVLVSYALIYSFGPGIDVWSHALGLTTGILLCYMMLIIQVISKQINSKSVL